MNNLKKALTRDDPKKYQKNKIQISAIKRSNQWNQIEWLVEKKTQKKGPQTNLDEGFKKILQGHVYEGEVKEFGKLLKDLKQKYKEFKPDQSHSTDGASNIISVLKGILQKQESAVSKKYIDMAIEGLQNYVKQKLRREKDKCLEDYNKLMKGFRPKDNKDEKKEEKKERMLTKLAHSTSATNLKIRVTRQEYQFQQDDTLLKRKKSLDLKNKSKGNASSHKNLDSANKLHMLLKDTNMKLIKTKIQYDYSAIFEASKSNIQPRNKTTYIEPKSEKQVLTKASKGKKDQAFVFYRPQRKQ